MYNPLWGPATSGNTVRRLPDAAALAQRESQQPLPRALSAADAGRDVQQHRQLLGTYPPSTGLPVAQGRSPDRLAEYQDRGSSSPRGRRTSTSLTPTAPTRTPWRAPETSHDAPVPAYPRPARAGITLTEILISIMIMGIGLLSLATLFPLGLLRIRDANRASRSARLIQSALDELQTRNLLNEELLLRILVRRQLRPTRLRPVRLRPRHTPERRQHHRRGQPHLRQGLADRL